MREQRILRVKDNKTVIYETLYEGDRLIDDATEDVWIVPDDKQTVPNTSILGLLRLALLDQDVGVGTGSGPRGQKGDRGEKGDPGNDGSSGIVHGIPVVHSEIDILAEKEQANNKRNTVYLNINNKKITLSDAASIYKIDRKTIARRLNLGWSHIDAVEIPLQRNGALRKKGLV